MNTINYISEDFGKLIENLKLAVEPYFYTYQDEYGIMTNEFSQFVAYNFDADVVDESNSLVLVYKPSKRSVNILTSFLNNKDIIYADSNTVSVTKSNCKDAARIVKQMIRLLSKMI